MENSLMLYTAKVSLSITLFYGLYMLCFRKDTFNTTKRLYLLSSIIISCTLPFCIINKSIFQDTPQIYEALLPEIIITQNANPVETSSLLSVNIYLILLISIVGSIILLSRLIIQIIQIIKLKLGHASFLKKKYRIIILNKKCSPFSFFKWIFISENKFEPDDENIMIAHETIHCKQYHSIDILLSEIMCIIFWWNPVSWLLKKEIKINLEYLADEGVLKQGYSIKKYQYLLLEITNENASIPIINNFNVSQLKKRIIMINRKRTKKLGFMKYLLVLPMAVLLITTGKANTTTLNTNIESSIPNMESKQKKVKGVYDKVETMPEFPGGDEAMMEYIMKSLKYPEEAATQNIEGRVVIRFVVSKEGSIKDIEVLRGIDPSCDAEAMRVVQEMPTWTPGMHKGKNVDAFYTLPILFKLSKD